MLKRKSWAAALLVLALFAALLTGCAPQEDSAADGSILPGGGTVILRVNPEISVHFNKEGLVTKLTGLNDDGRAIAEAYDDYIGKSARAVVQELVGAIKDAGYFVSEMEGEHRQITIQIEPGSMLPQEDFMEVLAGDVQSAVQAMSLDAGIVGIGPEDYERTDGAQEAAYLSQSKAKEIALLHAGLHAADVTFESIERDRDDGRIEYEVEFRSSDARYEYKIDAQTGRIISYEWESRPSAAPAPAPPVNQTPAPAPAPAPDVRPAPPRGDSGYSDYDDSRYDDSNYDDSGYDDSGYDDSHYDDSGYSDYD